MKWTVYASLKRPTINRSASATRSAKNAPQAFLAKDDSLDFFAYQKSSCSYLLVVVLRHHPSQRVHIISSTDEGSLEGSYRALYEGKIFRKTNKDAKKELEIRLLQECLNRGADRNASTALQDVNNSLGLEFFPTDDIRPGFLHAMSKGLHDLCVEKHRGSEILDLAMIMMDTALRDGASLTHLGRQGCYVGEALVACGDNVNAAKLFEEIADEYLDVGYDDVFLLFGKAMLAWRRAEASLIKILQSTRIDSLKQYRESVIRNFNELHQFYYLMNKESKQIDGEEIKMCLGIKYLTRAALNEAKPEYKQAVAHLIRKGYHDIDEDRAWKILGRIITTATDPACFRAAVLSYLNPNTHLYFKP
jgi:hypothetical protein